jgi:AcrR family transcriptional regulator
MTYEGPIVVDGVSYGTRLPRGRHGIPRALVTENQRERLMDAATAIFATEGFSALAVANLIDRAGVSRGTFYENFENKLACLLAAQRRAFGRLRAAIEAGCSSRREWPAAVEAGVAAALDFASRSPDDANLILASSRPSAEPRLVGQGISANEWILDLIHNSAHDQPAARVPGRLNEQAAVGAAISIVGSCLARDRVGPLPELTSALVRIILAPYLGTDADSILDPGIG